MMETVSQRHERLQALCLSLVGKRVRHHYEGTGTTYSVNPLTSDVERATFAVTVEGTASSWEMEMTDSGGITARVMIAGYGMVPAEEATVSTPSQEEVSSEP